jgi:hypothetical protein
MKLTRVQRKLLKVYERFNGESVTLSGILRLCFPSWPLLTLGVGYGYWMVSSGITLGWLVVGLCAGAMLRDVGRFQILLRTWPAVREIISWERVADLLRTHETDKA